MTADLASLMADEPVEEEPIYEFEKRNALRAFTRNHFRDQLRPLLEARERELLARVAELEALLVPDFVWDEPWHQDDEGIYPPRCWWCSVDEGEPHEADCAWVKARATLEGRTE